MRRRPPAEEAFRPLQASETNFQGLVFDINLSDNMSGWAAARRARELIPNVPVIYVVTSGAGDQCPHKAFRTASHTKSPLRQLN